MTKPDDEVAAVSPDVDGSMRFAIGPERKLFEMSLRKGADKDDGKHGARGLVRRSGGISSQNVEVQPLYARRQPYDAVVRESPATIAIIAAGCSDAKRPRLAAYTARS